MGCLGCDLLTMVILIVKGETAATMADIPLLFQYLFQDPEYMGALVKNLLLGLVFALLGMRGIFRQLKAEQAETSFTMQNLK